VRQLAGLDGYVAIAVTRDMSPHRENAALVIHTNLHKIKAHLPLRLMKAQTLFLIPVTNMKDGVIELALVQGSG